MNEKDVSVMVRNGILSLKGEKKSERDEKKDTYHLIERSYGACERSFQLPDSGGWTGSRDRLSNISTITPVATNN
jgi:HSP20 family molecular chaperone IbpA